MWPVNIKVKLAQRLHDFLDVGKSPRPADCIFVLSGRQERKAYGVKMWRFGYAPQLILSVGRFEWRKFRELNLESDGGLESCVAGIQPQRRHFFVRLDRQGASCVAVRAGRLGTRSEALALAQYLKDLPVRSLLIVSSPVHLRRAALAFRRIFRRSGVRLTFVATPERLPLESGEARALVWSEFCKYVLPLLLP